LELYEPRKLSCTDDRAALVDEVEPGGPESFHHYFPLYRKDDERRHGFQMAEAGPEKCHVAETAQSDSRITILLAGGEVALVYATA
jgi:hypothetical protein